MNTPRPLFFSELSALDIQEHRNLTLPPERHNFLHAAKTSLLPLTFAEAALALRNYPLVFVPEGDTLALVALSGLPGEGNRFVDAKGEWRPGYYIPAYVRGYPFIALRPNPDADPVLAFDPSAPDFSEAGGQALFTADGQASPQLQGIINFHGEYRQLAEQTQAMAKALQAAGVLEEGALQRQVPGQTAQKIGGFLMVSETRLRQLDAATLKTLQDSNALGLAYAQLFSMSSLGNLFEQEGEKAKPTATPKAKRASKQSAKAD